MFFSDTHGGHRESPHVESQLGALSKVVDTSTHGMTHILLHSGDFCRKYRTETSEDFNDWLGGDDNSFLKPIPVQHKIVILGNHEQEGAPAFPAAMNFEQQNFTFLYNQVTQLVVDLGGDTLGCLNVFGYFLPDPKDPSWSKCVQLMASADIILTHAPARKIDRMHHLQLVDALSVVSNYPPPNLKRRVHCSGHAHERHFNQKDDTRADKAIWVGAAQSQVDREGHAFMAPPRFLHLFASDLNSSALLSKSKFLADHQKKAQQQQQQQRQQQQQKSPQQQKHQQQLTPEQQR